MAACARLVVCAFQDFQVSSFIMALHFFVFGACYFCFTPRVNAQCKNFMLLSFLAQDENRMWLHMPRPSANSLNHGNQKQSDDDPLWTGCAPKDTLEFVTVTQLCKQLMKIPLEHHLDKQTIYSRLIRKSQHVCHTLGHGFCNPVAPNSCISMRIRHTAQFALLYRGPRMQPTLRFAIQECRVMCIQHAHQFEA